ncbi:protein of unknown function [Shewanella benthica]|uniref:Uncharacterized protein n=1 Tax=Shewanella benthica TaxID=43661 RepID=A0A330M7Y1_9GAMM|nr:protein of unknown function [Shewanella benthica]
MGLGFLCRKVRQHKYHLDESQIKPYFEFNRVLKDELFYEVKYPSIAGTATARDFVEFPSQFNEDGDINPEVIGHYAKHYQTGGLTLENGNKYRQAILSKGNSQDLMGDYMHFRGGVNRPQMPYLNAGG